MYKVGDKVRIVDVEKIDHAEWFLKNGQITEITQYSRVKNRDHLALLIPNSNGASLVILEEEYAGIEKVENDNE